MRASGPFAGPDQIAEPIREALKYIPAEQLIISADCGMGREGTSRRDATCKMVAMVLGTDIVRAKFGRPNAGRPTTGSRLQSPKNRHEQIRS